MASTSEAPTAAPGQYLGLFIGGEEYAIGILRVKEILQLDALTRIPGAPPGVRGVINVRGSVVPVADLATRFGLEETPLTRTTCVVIVETDIEGLSSVIGLMAESVSQVLDLRSEDIQPPPSFGTHARVDYLQGMARAGSRFTMILDVDRVLSNAQLLDATALAAPVAAAVPEAAEATAS